MKNEWPGLTEGHPCFLHPVMTPTGESISCGLEYAWIEEHDLFWHFFGCIGIHLVYIGLRHLPPPIAGIEHLIFDVEDTLDIWVSHLNVRPQGE